MRIKIAFNAKEYKLLDMDSVIAVVKFETEDGRYTYSFYTTVPINDFSITLDKPCIALDEYVVPDFVIQANISDYELLDSDE